MSTQSNVCVRGLRRYPVHLRLPDSLAPADLFLPMRRGLHLRRDLQLQGLPGRERGTHR